MQHDRKGIRAFLKSFREGVASNCKGEATPTYGAKLVWLHYTRAEFSISKLRLVSVQDYVTHCKI